MLTASYGMTQFDWRLCTSACKTVFQQHNWACTILWLVQHTKSRCTQTNQVIAFAWHCADQAISQLYIAKRPWTCTQHQDRFLTLLSHVLFGSILFDSISVCVLFDLVLIGALMALEHLLLIWHVYTQRRASGVSTQSELSLRRRLTLQVCTQRRALGVSTKAAGISQSGQSTRWSSWQDCAHWADRNPHWAGGKNSWPPFRGITSQPG